MTDKFCLHSLNRHYDLAKLGCVIWLAEDGTCYCPYTPPCVEYHEPQIIMTQQRNEKADHDSQ